MQFQFPVPSDIQYRITDDFAEHMSRPGNTAGGIDYAYRGSVLCARDGIVDQVNHLSTGYGTHVIVTHDDDPDYVWQTIYGHMERYSVPVYIRRGEAVAAGLRLGIVGSTGNSSGPHLHFGVRRIKRGAKVEGPWSYTWIDPAPLLTWELVQPLEFPADLPRPFQVEVVVPEWIRQEALPAARMVIKAQRGDRLPVLTVAQVSGATWIQVGFKAWFPAISQGDTRVRLLTEV